MKRIFTLMIALSFIGLMSGQNVLLNGDFESWDDANTPTSWTHIESITKDSLEVHTAGGYSAKHVSTGSTTDFGQLITGIIPGRQYKLEIWYKVTGGDETDARLWSKWSTDNTYDNETDKVALQGPGGGSSDYLNNNGGVWSTYSTTVTAPAEANEFYFEVRVYGSAITYWDDFSFTLQEQAGNLKPIISDIATSPMDITSTTDITISATIVDTDGTITTAGLNWGTESGVLANQVLMVKGEGDTYAVTIPAQANGTTIYYTIGAADDLSDYTLSTEKSFMVKDAQTATLPYVQGFDADMGDFYAFSASGATKSWRQSIYNEDGYMGMNGYGSGDLEKDYLITPGFDLSGTSNEILSYKTWRKYGSDDADNYLKLFYSTDYAGLGDPAAATWTEIATATFAVDAESWTETVDLDVSMAEGTNVHFAFIYNYNSGSYVFWEIDAVELKEGTATTIAPKEVKALSIFAYGRTLVINSDQNSRATVYNLAGQLVKEMNIETGRNEFSINRGGIYIVKVNNTIEKVVLR